MELRIQWLVIKGRMKRLNGMIKKRRQKKPLEGISTLCFSFKKWFPKSLSALLEIKVNQLLWLVFERDRVRRLNYVDLPHNAS